MNFNHLRVFWGVAKNLSYTKASEELFLSQPTISIQVKKLEEKLGMDLIDQLGKRIYLTEAGNLLYSYASQIFSLATEAESAVQELKGMRSGKVVVGASTTPGIYLLPAVIGSFQETHLDMDISLEIANSHEIQEQLLVNQLDLGVVGEELSIDPAIKTEPLWEDELVPIVAAGHPLADRQEISLEELLKQRLILRERGSSTRDVIEEKVRHEGKHVSAVMQLKSVEAIKQAVAANLGVSIVSRFAVGLEVQAGILRTLSLTDMQLVRKINLIYHKDKKLSPAVREFMDNLRKLKC
ncbi:MAG: selenium metabolism-associated LysR family transcriptional regulator [Bacillota bacterium]